MLSCVLLGARVQDSSLIPSPSAAEQAEAEKLIKDVFKEEYAKRAPADRLALARKMLAQASETRDDPKARFVLLREARELALQAGDVSTALQAVDELSRTFKVDSGGMRMSILALAVKNAKTPEELKVVVTLSIRMIDALLQSDEYDAAEKLAASTMVQAKKCQDLPLLGRASAKTKEVTEGKTRYEKLKKANETLVGTPEDPAANLLVGKYRCFNKDQWGGGLPLLAKGSDAALQSLAGLELSNPTAAADQLTLGDGWWDVAEKEAPAVRDVIKDHAAVWYDRAFAKLAGLGKAKVEKRLSELGQQKLARGTWVDATDPKYFGLSGKPGDPVELSAKQGFYQNVKMTQLPKGEFDGLTVRVTLDPAKDGMAWIVYEPQVMASFVDCHRGVFVNARDSGKEWKHEFSVAWPKREQSVITILLVGGEYVVHLDGREMTRVKTSNPKITQLILEVRDGAAKFDRIQFRKVE